MNRRRAGDPQIPEPLDCIRLVTIANRAWDAAQARHDKDFSLGQVIAVLTLCHVSCCPLRLADMVKGRDIDLVHDVFGIVRHYDSRTLTLTDGFAPRFAA